jgi:tetratricopeptide (TPR) repeat protein
MPEVLTALHSALGWRILHLATHGVFEFIPEEGAPPVTGVVLDGGAFLQPQDFNQLRYVPELVFLNCCHGGNTQGELLGAATRYPQLAANLATQFIRMGARAVVAAGWAVNDAAAQLFADTFYAQMLAGQTFGTATRRARAEVYDRFPHVNTWGAYQCYGDPAFSLMTAASEASAASMVCDRELWLFADAILQRAKAADATEAARLIALLDSAVSEANPEWLNDARTLVALGMAFGELRRFDQAISLLRKARTAASGEMSLRALEQLANFESRYAEGLWNERDTSAGPELRRTVDEFFHDAQRLFSALVQVAPTSERFSMLGSHYKRQSMVANKTKARKQALEKMRDEYYRAHAKKVEAGEDDPWYPLGNAAVGELALQWQTAGGTAEHKWAQDQQTVLESLRGYGDALASHPALTDFWATTFLADLALIEALTGDGSFGGSMRLAEERYKAARKRGGSAREFDSVVTQVRFLRSMAEQSPQEQVRGEVAQQLRDLVTALQSIGD